MREKARAQTVQSDLPLLFENNTIISRVRRTQINCYEEARRESYRRSRGRDDGFLPSRRFARIKRKILRSRRKTPFPRYFRNTELSSKRRERFWNGEEIPNVVASSRGKIVSPNMSDRVRSWTVYTLFRNAPRSIINACWGINLTRPRSRRAKNVHRIIEEEKNEKRLLKFSKERNSIFRFTLFGILFFLVGIHAFLICVYF